MSKVDSILYRQLDQAHRLLEANAGSTSNPVSSAGVFGDSPNLPDIYYVDSGNGSDGNDGRDPKNPMATIDAAINRCTASQGDVVLVQPGHAETLTTQISLDVIGVSIIGVGEGVLRPQITINAAIDGIDIGAANCLVENIGFPVSTAGATSQVNVDAADATVRECHFAEGASDLLGTITVTASGEVCTIEYNTVVVTADGPDEWILVEGVVDRLTIRKNTVVCSDGSDAFDLGAVNCAAVAVTNLLVVDNDFQGADVFSIAVVGTALVGETIARNTYSGGAIEGVLTEGEYIPGLGYRVTKTAARTSGAGADDLFDITGLCKVTLFVGKVTSVLTSFADLVLNEKTNSVALNAITVLDDDAADTLYNVTGDPSQTLNGGAAPALNYAGNEGQELGFLINGDTIEATWTEAGTVGTIAWTLFYIPLEADAKIVAAA